MWRWATGRMLRQCVVTDGVHVPADTSWIGVTIRRADGELAPDERASATWRSPAVAANGTASGYDSATGPIGVRSSEVSWL